MGDRLKRLSGGIRRVVVAAFGVACLGAGLAAAQEACFRGEPKKACVAADLDKRVAALRDPLLAKLHRVYKVNELYDGCGAYSLVNPGPGEVHGFAWGPAQFNLASPEGNHDLFLRVLAEARDERGEPFLDDDARAFLAEAYDCGQKDAAYGNRVFTCRTATLRRDRAIWGRLCDLEARINDALGSKRGRELLDEAYLVHLKRRREELKEFTAALRQTTTREAMARSEFAQLFVLDWRNNLGEPISLRLALNGEVDAYCDLLHDCRRTREPVVVDGRPAFTDLLKLLFQTRYAAGIRTDMRYDALRRLNNVAEIAGADRIDLAGADHEYLRGTFTAMLDDADSARRRKLHINEYAALRSLLRRVPPDPAPIALLPSP